MSEVNRSVFADSTAATLLLVTILVFLVLLAAPCWAQQFENDKLLASDGEAGDNFGHSVALSGTRALIGTYDDLNGSVHGSAYVFGHDSVSGTWQEEAKLTASDGAYWDLFGHSVALSDERIFIGAPYDNDNGWNSGSVYFFGYDDVSGTWHEEAKLTASDNEPDDQFGWSISLLGMRALVGANYDDDNGDNSGSAYVFHYDSVSGSWLEDSKLLASDGMYADFFGCSCSLSGTRALIGAWQHKYNVDRPGAAYLFGYDSVSGTWQEEAKLLASDGADHDYFGWSVALSGDVALVGAYQDDDNGTNSGSAYVFRYDSVSETWLEEAKLLASDGDGIDSFGYSVALSGNRALIGARWDDDYGYKTGSSYVFVYDSVSGTWHEEAKLLTSDSADRDNFGHSVALSGDGALIGAYCDDNENGSTAGSAYTFDFTSVLSLDVKCNGQDQNVIVDSGENVTLTIDIDNGYHPGLEGDFWVVAILPISGWNTWTYGPWINPIWRVGAGNEYYTGPPLNHAATVCDQPLPPGSYKLYLAMDAIPNGVLDLTALWDFDVVDFAVQ